MKAWVIAKKELRDMFRDKRVVNGAFVMPVVMIIMFIMLIGFVEQSLTTKPDLSIGVPTGTNNIIIEAFEKSKVAKIIRIKDEAEGLAKMKNGDLRLVLGFSPDFEQGMESGKADVTAHYLDGEPLSQIAMASVQKVIDETNKAKVKVLLQAKGVSPELADPIKLESKDASGKDGLAGSAVVRLLPYLIVLWAFYGGFSIVSDLVAGEKERGTMETLLISPVRRRDIAFGKFISLAVVCLTSSLSSLVAVIILGSLNLEMTKTMFPTGMHVSVISVVGMFVVLVPLVAFFASSMIAVSAYARNLREAQTYLTLFSFLVIMPAVFSQFIGLTGSEKATWVQWTPILNSAVALKDALDSNLKAPVLIGTIVTSTVLAAIGWWISAKLFEREQIVTRV